MALSPRVVLVSLLALGLAAGLGVLALQPAPVPGTWWAPPCLVHDITGLYCPGCGATRATHALMHGDVLGALRMNALLVLLPPFLAWWLGPGLWRWMRHSPDASQPPFRAVGTGITALVVIGLYTVLRNLPWPPFAWLAPL